LATTYADFQYEAQKIRDLYKDQISLLIGAEIEFINKDYAQHVDDLRKTYKADYVVGSLHHVNSVPIDFSPELYQEALGQVNGQLKDLYIRYFDEQYIMLQSVKPEVVGHFDLIRIFADQSIADKTLLESEVWECVVRNIDYIVEYGGLFEINSRSWKKGLRDAYPQRDIIKVFSSSVDYILPINNTHILSNRSLMKRVANLHYLMIAMDLKMWDYSMKSCPITCQKLVSARYII
jgi:histidinol-phosphatase (PHP family)